MVVGLDLFLNMEYDLSVKFEGFPSLFTFQEVHFYFFITLRRQPLLFRCFTISSLKLHSKGLSSRQLSIFIQRAQQFPNKYEKVRGVIFYCFMIIPLLLIDDQLKSNLISPRLFIIQKVLFIYLFIYSFLIYNYLVNVVKIVPFLFLCSCCCCFCFISWNRHFLNLSFPFAFLVVCFVFVVFVIFFSIRTGIVEFGTWPKIVVKLFQMHNFATFSAKFYSKVRFIGLFV